MHWKKKLLLKLFKFKKNLYLMMNKYFILLIIFILSCTSKSRENKETLNINTGKYIYKFDKKIEAEILKSLNNIDESELVNFGLNFALCDVDGGNFILSIFYKTQSADEIHYENTNKFANINDSILLPIITSDIIFLEKILIKKADKIDDSIIVFRNPIKSIYFNEKNEITKIDTLNSTGSIIVKNRQKQ